MSNAYPTRIRAFRDHIIRHLPRVPNDKASLASMQTLTTSQLISAYAMWRMRFIPQRPRRVTFWPEGVTPSTAAQVRLKLRPLLMAVAAGNDLTPFLSDLVHRKGFILPRARQGRFREDIDQVLTRHGLHHFHVGIAGPGNPKGRSGTLVFADVLEKEFRIVAVDDHGVFVQCSPAHSRFFKLCLGYASKDIPPGQGFMLNPVMSNGESLDVRLFARQCEHVMSGGDAELDNPITIDNLYAQQPMKGGLLVSRPTKPKFAWHMEDLRFGILEKTTNVFFCLLTLSWR